MMKTLLCAFIILTSISSCSKDFLKSYESRIAGTWTIVDVDGFGLGGSLSELPFRSGTFTFFEDGRLLYVATTNDSLKGSWNIDKLQVDEDRIQRLEITAVNFTTQEVFSEVYDDVQFTGTNRFNATINKNFHTYVTRFRR